MDLNAAKKDKKGINDRQAQGIYRDYQPLRYNKDPHEKLSIMGVIRVFVAIAHLMVSTPKILFFSPGFGEVLIELCVRGARLQM